MTTGDPPTLGEARELLLIRTVHSAIFLVMLGSILWLVVTGLTGRRDRLTAVAAALVAGEAAVFVANAGVCPLTPLAEARGASSGSVSDIFLPDAIAHTIPVWSTALIALAAVLHLRGALAARRPEMNGARTVRTGCGGAA
ncbi:MAG: hypothetical protein ABIR11_12125 [Candidatus Limnocylindrales bacterium]